ncbi:hypothetical protein ATCC90586_006458 [Pythium insidiosum]|nr:hypothetical protein ATCC90586_006458 [Pythium insidiosum]
MAPHSIESHYERLRDAVFDNDAELFEQLLQRDGVDVDHLDAGGQTLLHLASFWGRMAIVKLLLNAGASLKTKNAAGCTALDLATHWGHTSVAEVLRLRGGRSVWEDKMGHLQVQVEDLRLQNVQAQQQLEEKKRELEELLDEYHSLHKRHEEEKGAHVITQQTLSKRVQECDELQRTNDELKQQLEQLRERFRVTMIEQAALESERNEARREVTAAIAHRDQILREMQVSVAKQEELAHAWRQAEMAAAIADSQRNFSLGEKEKLHKRHTATIGELVVATDRLHATQEELMTLKTELAEYIFEMERDRRALKRVAKFFEAAGIDTPGTRPQTTPATNATGTYTPGEITKKTHFSMAAREYGDRLRLREQRKQQARYRRHDQLENQYLTQGLSMPLLESDRFQHEFVTTLNAFATTRQEKWSALKRERDRQIGFTKNVMARAIATAPTPFRRRDSASSTNSAVSSSSQRSSSTTTTSTSTNTATAALTAPSRRSSTAASDEDAGLGLVAVEPTPNGRLLPGSVEPPNPRGSLKRQKSVNLDIYAQDGSRPTTPMEARMRSAFVLSRANSIQSEVAAPSPQKTATLPPISPSPR